MKKFIIFIIILIVPACKINKVVKHHGVHFLDKKHQNLVILNTNKNDIIKLLGPPSTKSTFDNELWIYIERKTSSMPIYRLGKKKTIVNNVLVLEINNMGLLAKKDFLNIDDMNEINFTDKITLNNYKKKSFVYDFLSSMRQRINDPLGKRKKIE